MITRRRIRSDEAVSETSLQIPVGEVHDAVVMTISSELKKCPRILILSRIQKGAEKVDSSS